MTTMRVVGECFFWYRLTRVFPDKFHRAVKRLCVVCDWPREVLASGLTNSPSIARGDIFKLWKIIDIISEMVQDRHTGSYNRGLIENHCMAYQMVQLPIALSRLE